jgi:hypothetical protein
MSAEYEGGILSWIRKNCKKSNTITRTDICHYCETQFAIPFTRGWVDSFISCHQTALTETRATMADMNILGAFRQIGLTVYVIDIIVRIHFQEIHLRESPGFQELWEINYPPENLYTRRRNA